MFGRDIISDIDYTVHSKMKVGHIRKLMHNLEVGHLILLKGDIFLGIVSEEDLLDVKSELFLADVGEIELRSENVHPGDHILDIYQRFIASGISVMPILDERGKYKGGVTREDIFISLGEMFSFSEPGSLVVLKMKKRDYSLSEISRIIEGENTSVLTSLISSDIDPEHINITLKLNSFDIQRIISTLERHEFQVVAFFSEENYEDFLSDRYDQFINYLNI
jgi:acetoin utilization protein AcuB